RPISQPSRSHPTYRRRVLFAEILRHFKIAALTLSKRSSAQWIFAPVDRSFRYLPCPTAGSLAQTTLSVTRRDLATMLICNSCVLQRRALVDVGQMLAWWMPADGRRRDLRRLELSWQGARCFDWRGVGEWGVLSRDQKARTQGTPVSLSKAQAQFQLF